MMIFTDDQLKKLSIFPHFTAMLSICGSLLIIFEVLTDFRKRGKLYHRLMLGLSCSDLIMSSSYFFSSWAVPKGTVGVFSPLGNTATCNAQAFFMQYGVAIPLYNVSLATYFMFIVRNQWPERKCVEYEKWLHGVPVTVGLSTSVAGLLLGTYGFSDLWCWIKSEYKIQRLILHAVPLLLALVTSMVLFVFSFKSIKRLEASFAAKGIQVSRNDKTISRQLITHCFIYNFIYWFTYLPGLIVRTAQLANEDFNPPFALVLFMSCNLPLQGFWNWFNYKRLKIQKCCCRLETQLEEDFSYSRTPVRSGVSKSVAVDGDVEINDDSTSSNRRVFDWPGDRNETDAGLCSSAIMFEQM